MQGRRRRRPRKLADDRAGLEASVLASRRHSGFSGIESGPRPGRLPCPKSLATGKRIRPDCRCRHGERGLLFLTADAADPESAWRRVMTVTMQILSGSLLLAVCSLIHLCVFAGAARLLRALGAESGRSYGVRVVKLMGTGLAAAVAAHTVQVWIWAAVFVIGGALPDLAEAIYLGIISLTERPVSAVPLVQ